MARSKFSLLLLLTITLWSCFLINSIDGFVAINWGRQASHRLMPSMVVDLLLQNNIRHLKVFSPADNVLKVFAGGDISITSTLPNDGLEWIETEDLADKWLQQRIGIYKKYNVKIEYLHVGVEPFSLLYKNKSYDNAVEVFRMVQQTMLNRYGDSIKATTPHFTDVLKHGIKKPSDAEFRPDLVERMNIFVRLLNNTNAPFVMNIFPIHYVTQNGWDMEFAFIDNKSNFTIYDDKTKLVYRNAFEFAYDSFLTAIAKVGAPDLTLMVGQIGWPTDGFPGANATNAERFYRGLLPFVTSKKGTPLRPGISIDVYIQSLVDENMNKVTYGAFQRHYGVYRSNGEPKYKIDFTGLGRDMYPTTAKGIILMPKRWCIYNGINDDLKKVKHHFDAACSMADCTALAPGGSCSHLTFNQNVSYAFNRVFQLMSQDSDKACDFEGLGSVVPDDPSDGTCKFQVEILTGEFKDNAMVLSKNINTSNGGRKLRCGLFVGSNMSLLVCFVLVAILNILHFL